VKDGATARQMVGWAANTEFRAQSTPGTFDSGSSLIDKDIVLAADADVIGHINGDTPHYPTIRSSPCARTLRAPSRSFTTATKEPGF